MNPFGIPEPSEFAVSATLALIDFFSEIGPAQIGVGIIAAGGFLLFLAQVIQ